MVEVIELEYQSARERIEKEIDEINKNEVLYATFFVATHAALFQFHVSNPLFLFFVSLILLLIPLYGIARYQAHANIIMINENYIQFHIEPQFNLDRYISYGLIKYYNEEKVKFFGKGFIRRTIDDFFGLDYDLAFGSKSGRLKRIRYSFWLIMIIASTIFLFIVAAGGSRVSSIYEEQTSEKVIKSK